MSERVEGFEVIQPQAAGIDVGAAEHWVSVPEHHEPSVRVFGCFTPDLEALANWLSACEVTTVAMESTGVYWIPLFEILERRGFEVCLVNARHVKTVPGRKSDYQDCQWLRQLHSCGLLAASFRPEDEICVLRRYIRHRAQLVRSSTVHIQRMQKALDEMNLHLHRVLSDITGKTGLSILRAILAGERDPHQLAALRDPRVKRPAAEIAAALSGNYRDELLFVLGQELALYDTYRAQIETCDQQIEQYLSSLESAEDVEASPPTPPKRRSPRGNSPRFDLHSHLYRISGVDFTQIDGLDTLSVLTILSEVGLDPTRFPTMRHFTSWLGLSPNLAISGGKVKSSRTRKVVNRAAQAFRMAAQTLHRSQSAVGAFYRRIKARSGAPKAITATAHKLARIFYSLWRSGEAYDDPGAEAYEQQYRQRLIKSLERKAQALGLELVPKESPPQSLQSVS